MTVSCDSLLLPIVQYSHDGVQYLTMETISFVPIQLKMVIPEMLNKNEVGWVSCLLLLAIILTYVYTPTFRSLGSTIITPSAVS